jgi:hypothetical protein
VSKRTKFLLGIGVIAALVIGFQVAAYAVHDDVFELDGNAVDNPAGGQDDWSNIPEAVTAAGSQNPANNPGDSTFLTETPANAQSIFTTGGSKDPNDLDQWRWKDGGGLPDKDNLLHAFAARYTPTTGPEEGDELLYFGSDRFDNSGDAVQGFWFFQQQVDNVPGGTFSGLHEDGDLLILTDFSNGGGVSTIAVYQWLDGGLSPVASSNSANCANPADDRFCGIVNPASGPGITNGITPSPWAFLDKSGNTGFANGEFFEGGLNLTDLNLGDRCFSTVAAESRSSTSTTATLKDFVLGDLASCEPGMTTQASTNGTVTPGTAVTDTATIKITGATEPEDPTGDVTFFLCGPDTSAPPDCSTGGTNVGTGTLEDSSDPANTTDGIASATSPEVNTASTTGNLAPGNYCFRAVWPGDSNYAGDSHTNTDTECFEVSQPTSVDTVQRWVPQDTATVNPASVTGTVTFTLYSTTDCTGTPLDTFTDDSAPYETNNTTIIADTEVSWRASFDATNAEDSTGVCETATVTFDDNGPNVP